MNGLSWLLQTLDEGELQQPFGTNCLAIGTFGNSMLLKVDNSI
jgi:hypothetical protein